MKMESNIRKNGKNIPINVVYKKRFSNILLFIKNIFVSLQTDKVKKYGRNI
jgi:hypothetical protein